MNEKFDALSKPFPKSAYKELNFGRKLTTIDAYHIVERLTEVFGLCGDGWGLCNNRGEDGAPVGLPGVIAENGSVAAYGCLWYRSSGPNVYGFVTAAGDAKVMKGNIAEAYKKALTNLISKASSYIGVGFNIYKGESLDDPYVDTANEYKLNK